MALGANPAFADGGRVEALASVVFPSATSYILLRWASYGDNALASRALLDTVLALGALLSGAAMVAH
jgi:hypothetical protein